MVSLTNTFQAMPSQLSNGKQNIQVLQRFDTRTSTILNPGYDYNTLIGKKKQFYMR